MISNYNEGGPALIVKYSVIDAAKNKYCPCKEYQTRDNLYYVIERSVRVQKKSISYLVFCVDGSQVSKPRTASRSTWIVDRLVKTREISLV